MAYEESLGSITITASGDLSAHQFKIMQQTTTGAALASATSDVVGVLQNKPAALGRASEVAYSGISKVLCRSTIAVGDLVASSSVGIGTAVVIGASSVATFCIGRLVDVAVATTEAGGVMASVLLDQQTLNATS